MIQNVLIANLKYDVFSICSMFYFYYFSETPKSVEDKNKSGLDALSLICQAVLLDHNYNATLPPDSPTRPSPPIVLSAQVNGVSPSSAYSPSTTKSEIEVHHCNMKL